MHAHGLSKISKKFYRNVRNDEMKYSKRGVDYLDNFPPEDHFIREIRSYEDHKTLGTIDTTEIHDRNHNRYRYLWDGDVESVERDSSVENNRPTRLGKYFDNYLSTSGTDNSEYYGNVVYTNHDDGNAVLNEPLKSYTRRRYPSLVFKNDHLDILRRKRDAMKEGDKIEKPVVINVEDTLGEPLEISTLGVENTTTQLKGSFREPKELKVASNVGVLNINDFIRFKRDVNSMVGRNKTNIDDQNYSTTKHERENDLKPKRESRLLQGTKEQWAKQRYPVFDDYKNTPFEKDRFPVVHFVTQNHTESILYPTRRNFDEEDYEMMDERRYNRYPRHFDRSSEIYYGQRDLESPYSRNRYYFDRDYKYLEPKPPAPQNRNRIIYYAALPEVVRAPFVEDFRNRYGHGYDRRDVNLYPLNVVTDPHNRRTSYRPQKSKPGEIDGGNSPYPAKVSRDVNVLQIKKNPERRIYSEVDRRYGYDLAPFRV